MHNEVVDITGCSAHDGWIIRRITLSLFFSHTFLKNMFLPASVRGWMDLTANCQHYQALSMSVSISIGRLLGFLPPSKGVCWKLDCSVRYHHEQSGPAHHPFQLCIFGDPYTTHSCSHALYFIHKDNNILLVCDQYLHAISGFRSELA